MKKIILLTFILIIYGLPFPATALGETYYLIQLKNGGSLATPLYWQAGTQVFFFYAGGMVGIEKTVVTKVEKHEIQTISPPGATQNATGTKETAPAPPQAAKSPGPEKPPAAKIPEEKMNIADYKNKKDLLTVELENLLEKRREARQRKDEEAREKLTEEIRNISAEIYGITDEVTKQNQGQLPEGWWNK